MMEFTEQLGAGGSVRLIERNPVLGDVVRIHAGRGEVTISKQMAIVLMGQLFKWFGDLGPLPEDGLTPGDSPTNVEDDSTSAPVPSVGLTFEGEPDLTDTVCDGRVFLGERFLFGVKKKSKPRLLYREIVPEWQMTSGLANEETDLGQALNVEQAAIWGLFRLDVITREQAEEYIRSGDRPWTILIDS